MKLICGIVVAVLGFLVPAAASAATLCTAIADGTSGKVLLEEGDCRTRVTPASTFKIPLAVIGYDSGFLKDENNPALPFKKGYADWGGPDWKQTTTPARWLKHSVVWYSQQISHALGKERLAAYTTAFGYGNSDWSGDKGKDNALDRAWIGSSLKISPAEQVAFLRQLVNRRLPVSRDAMDKTDRIIERSTAAGWTVAGKTGSAFPRKRDGSLDRARGWGWYVGWAEKNGRTFVFARLNQDETLIRAPGGLRARKEFLEGWDQLVKRLPD